jgi:hypothetical protein
MKSESHDSHRFSEAFKSEDELRKHLSTLLKRMPHTQGVQITHGPQEYGKDIVFYAPDGFYNYQLNACVVKNTKISGSVDDNAGARAVFIQAEQALDTPFINGAGEEERVSKAFIVSPFDCSQITMHSIEGNLKNHFGKVEFLCGVKLFEKFSEYWPEFVIFESTLLGTYVAALQQNFDQSDPITFLASQHYILSSVNKTLKNVYVRQGFKVSLQEFDLVVERPSIQTLLGPVTEREVEDVREQVEFAIPLIRRTQVWETPNNAAASELATSLKRFSTELKEKWAAEWEMLQRQHSEEGKRPPARLSTELRLRDLDGVMKAPHVSQLMDVLKAFEARVAQANDLARKGKEGEVALNSEEYLNYCRVREVTHLYPSAFRKIAHIGDKYYPETLLDQIHNCVLITAPAGFGKTSFCKWNTLNDVQRLIDKTATVIPIYVPLHQLATAKVETCEDAFLRSPEVKEMFFAAHKNRQRVRVYLDGLDEVTTIDQQEKLMNLAAQLSQKYSPIQIVVTGRDYVSGPWLRWLSRIQLSELNPQQVSQLVSKWLDDDPAECSVFQKQLLSTKALQALMKVPLLGTLTIAVFKKMKSLPESKVKLYEVFVDLMCGGWDLAKNIRRETRFGSQAKLGVLTRLAGLLHLNSKREAQEADIRTAVKQTMGAFADQWRNLLDEILEDGLLIRLGANSLAFSHLSFQEYLAASELTDPNGNRQQVMLRRYLSGEDWWREVLAFYVGMSKRPDETEGWIRKTTAEMSKMVQDLPQRSKFLVDALASAWPGWVPRKD